MDIKRINAIVYKQFNDTLKNKAVLIQFIMFPAMALILTLSAKDFGLEENFFVNMFSTMYISMAPLIVVSTIVSEDKEKGTLQILRMSNVKPLEYIMGIALYVFILCIIGLVTLALIGNYRGNELILFTSINTFGLCISIMIGSVIGLISPNQNASNGLSVPAMLIFSFLPMLASFNNSIYKVSKLVYSQQINDIIFSMKIELSNVIILFANLVIISMIYIIVYNKYKFE